MLISARFGERRKSFNSTLLRLESNTHLHSSWVYRHSTVKCSTRSLLNSAPDRTSRSWTDSSVEDVCGFHALFPTPLDASDLFLKVDAQLDALHLGLTGVTEGTWPRRRYCREGLPHLEFNFEIRVAWSQFGLFPIDRAMLSAYGVDTIAEVVRGVCRSVDAALGRTYYPEGVGFVTEGEVAGNLDFVDWIQYFGPRVAGRWTIEHLRRGPFFRVHAESNGGCTLVLASEPFSGVLPRRQAAEHLGIHLRPFRMRDSSGKWLEREWP